MALGPEDGPRHVRAGVTPVLLRRGRGQPGSRLANLQLKSLQLGWLDQTRSCEYLSDDN